MNKRELSKKLWAAYRQAPLLPANISEPRRVALRGVIGCVSSVEHLRDSISSHISDGYKENSSVIQTLRIRLAECEKQLEQYEGFLYDTEEIRA